MPSGIIVIDKPSDWTSMDVCAKLRGRFHEKRVGHGGTLDPMATGVLPVFLGRATRAVTFASESEKEYQFGLKLGVVTNTQDVTGEIVRQTPFTGTAEDLLAVLPKFRGDIQQVPPMYSAIKINGQKLYDLARKGREVERAPRPVTIHALELEDQLGPDEFLLRVRCSKGTYVRTLCHDIGAAVGCGGCMSSLRRTMAAGFTLAAAGGRLFLRLSRPGGGPGAGEAHPQRRGPAYARAARRALSGLWSGRDLPGPESGGERRADHGEELLRGLNSLPLAI